jgi:CRISPR-associated protein Cas1
MPAADKVVEISDSAVHLSVRHEQLVVRTESDTEVSVPLVETIALILSGRRATTTQPVLAGVMRNGGAILVCDNSYLPVGLMLPLGINSLQTERTLAQAQISVPRKKRLWQQIVKAKIIAQAAVLERTYGKDAGLRQLAKKVNSGDRSNVEGLAAQRYWPRLFNNVEFRRRREGGGPNKLLNYGYAVLRAAVGRSICAAGLHPSLGLHHHHRNNSWCLADDIMEPYRPIVDEIVVHWVDSHGYDCELTREAKSQLVGILTERLCSQGDSRTLIAWIEKTVASLVQAYLGKAGLILFPDGLFDGNTP